MSLKLTPASSSAARPASRPMMLWWVSGYIPKRIIPTPRIATFSICSALRRPEPDDDDVLAVLFAQRLQLANERHADAEVLTLARERDLEPRTFGEVDLADAVALHVLDAHGAEERHVDEGEAVEASARGDLRFGGTTRQALGAHQSLGEEVLPAVLAARADHLGRGGGIVGDGEVPGLHGYAETDVGHRGGDSVTMATRKSRLARSGRQPAGGRSSKRRRGWASPPTPVGDVTAAGRSDDDQS